MVVQRGFAFLFVAFHLAAALRRQQRAGATKQNGGWLATKTDEAFSKAASVAEFRGTFRDLTLWKGANAKKATSGPLWVVEYQSGEDMVKESVRAESLDLKIMFREGLTLVIQGNIPETLGYDACGAAGNKTVLSVSDSEVTPRQMPTEDYDKYLALAQAVNPANVQLREAVSQDSLRSTIELLQGFKTRNSYSGEDGGLDQAASWAATQFEEYGFSVSRDDFQPKGRWPWSAKRITPQVVAELRGTEHPDRIVVVGAHIDSISPLRQVAPGADDNGSGVSVILELARIIAAGGAKFKNTLRLVLFTGEEQGLYGSRAMAKANKEEGQDIICMLNVDMVGYRVPGEPITFSMKSRFVDEGLTKIVETAVTTYTNGELPVGYSNSCCSDFVSFYENGIPAMGLFETPTTRVVNPEYHSTKDLLEGVGVDMDQVEQCGSAFMANALLFAEISSVGAAM